MSWRSGHLGNKHTRNDPHRLEVEDFRPRGPRVRTIWLPLSTTAVAPAIHQQPRCRPPNASLKVSILLCPFRLVALRCVYTCLLNSVQIRCISSDRGVHPPSAPVFRTWHFLGHSLYGIPSFMVIVTVKACEGLEPGYQQLRPIFLCALHVGMHCNIEFKQWHIN